MRELWPKPSTNSADQGIQTAWKAVLFLASVSPALPRGGRQTRQLVKRAPAKTLSPRLPSLMEVPLASYLPAL